METEFITRAEILSDLWMNYRDDEEFTDFVDYNDLGLPLAYAVTTAMVKPNATAEAMINETFDLLLGSLGITEDTGFATLEDLLGEEGIV